MPAQGDVGVENQIDSDAAYARELYNEQVTYNCQFPPIPPLGGF